MINTAPDILSDGGRATPVGSPFIAEAVAITRRFGPTVALEGVGIAIKEGEAHGLVGRNGAGKSTLVSILTGLQRPDGGEVRFSGEPAPAPGNRSAWRRRVACVYQYSTVIPTLTVAENLFLNRQAEGPRAISWRDVRRRARELLSQWGVDVDPRRLAGDLSVEQRQMLEIARALSFGTRFIILDEPTAQLDGRSIERLFDRLRGLQASGVAFLFISHHLEEVYQVCQSVTVLRDGRHVLTRPVAEVSRAQMVEAMTAEAMALTDVGSSRRVVTTDTVLELRDLSLKGAFEPLSLQVRAGEVTGLAGGVGSGKVEVAETIVGLLRASSGEVVVDGRVVKPNSVPASLKAGIGFVPIDRRRQGLIPLLSVADNITLAVGDRLGPGGLIRRGTQRAIADRMFADLDIKARSISESVSNLSGGNQQKVVMARALATDPHVLVLVTPTAGVDVRAKVSLMARLDRAANAGTAVLLVSDELDELRRCNRVLILFQGRMIREFSGEWSDRDLVAAMEGVDDSAH